MRPTACIAARLIHLVLDYNGTLACNGRNDHRMLEAAALGVAVLQGEGASVEALMAADVVVPDILAALNLLLLPQRLIATLRS